MKKLTETDFRKSQLFLETKSRHLEQTLFNYHFHQEGGSRKGVIKELIKYQNLDGGFGKALEPDLRMKASSVVATKFALQILIDIETPVTEKTVKDCITYLMNNYDKEKQVWSLVTSKVMEAPHAPWWDHEGLEKEFGDFLANPKAGILRCLLDYKELVTTSLINEVTSQLIAHLNTLPIEMPFFDAISFLQLTQSNNLNNELKKHILSKLSKTAKRIVNTNPQDWKKFSIKPLWLAPAPSSPLAEVLKKEIEKNLDFEINNQNEDGSWSPTWTWGDHYQTDWEIAENEWKGILTLATLRSLRDYNRIENCLPRDSSTYKYHID
jgi:hypothetical protein